MKLTFILNFECIAVIRNSKTGQGCCSTKANVSSTSFLRHGMQLPNTHDPQSSQKSVINAPHPLFDWNTEEGKKGVRACVDTSLVEYVVLASDTVYNGN